MECSDYKQDFYQNPQTRTSISSFQAFVKAGTELVRYSQESRGILGSLRYSCVPITNRKHETYDDLARNLCQKLDSPMNNDILIESGQLPD